MRRLIQILLALGLVGVLGCASGVALFYAFILRDLPEIRSLDDYRPKLITRVLAADGSEIASMAEQRRVIVPIEEIPRHVVEAFIAAEDSSFYDHEGLDYPGILRAAVANLRAGSVKQGGSTITQQVAKTFLLSSERSLVRKLKDMVLAMRIERYLDKNQILFLYLNQIYLGSGAYGIEAAAQTYFGKSVRELDVSEAALVAGLVPAPSIWTPFRNPDIALSKQQAVLQRMQKSGFIKSEQEYQRWLAKPLRYREQKWEELESAAACFVEEVRRYLVARYGSDRVLTGGLTVRTTMNPRRQVDAYRTVRRGLHDHDRRQGYRGPIRNVPREDWESVQAAITETNAQVEPSEEQLYRALVMRIDDDAQQARLVLGGARETMLAFDDVSWARKPDPEVDGAVPQLRRISQALQVGDLVWLEKTGERFELYQQPLAEGSLIAIDLQSRYLEAMIGGYSFNRSQFNRALQSRRQPGSGFKPIVYAAALDNGYTPATIVHDTAIVYEDKSTGLVWKPENYSDKFYGPIPLRDALAKSRNVATIKILGDIGVGPVQKMARRLGIDSHLESNLGLALGNSEVTLAELVRAYTVFASGGRLIDPIFILEVRGRNGELLEQNVPLLASQAVDDGDAAQAQPAHESVPTLEAALPSVVRAAHAEARTKDDAAQALDPVTSYLMVDMLRAVIEDGTGQRVRALGRPVAGKTGTTNDLHDAWFIGFTPDLVAGVWVGYDNAHSLGKNETGARAAGPLFLEFMQAALKDRPVRDFPVPDGVVFARVNPKTGLRALPNDVEAAFQPFREGTVPQEAESAITRTARPRLD